MYLPHGMRKVVRCWSSSRSGTKWYPFHASRTVFVLFGGTAMHCRNGAFVGCIYLRQAWFSFWRSTTLLGFPDFLATTCMGAHHMVGSPTSLVLVFKASHESACDHLVAEQDFPFSRGDCEVAQFGGCFQSGPILTQVFVLFLIHLEELAHVPQFVDGLDCVLLDLVDHLLFR